MFHEMIANAEEFNQALGLPYRIVNIVSGKYLKHQTSTEITPILYLLKNWILWVFINSIQLYNICWQLFLKEEKYNKKSKKTYPFN